MEVTLSWKGKMSFEGVSDTGFVQKMDADTSVGGDNGGARPMEFIAIGLAGCTAMDVISILRKKQQDVTGFEVRVQADRAAEHPKVFTRMVVVYHVTGHNVDEVALHRAIELSAAKYCPAQAMLAKVVPMELKYEIYEEGGKLVKAGIFTPAAG
jgi:putative redox protein